MTYYRVKESADNNHYQPISKNLQKGYKSTFWYMQYNSGLNFLVGNELLSTKVYERLVNETSAKCEWFDKVEISKKDTYWFFGARFGINKGYNS